ncbi:hypothetical protein IAQ61_004745 [Plenodomus lingam]|uniref:uncharacterized protein n=1 Tax=Leptosphaeria maculans TaxID=5022 RepID=UPI003326A031|nr:hypothetical protein IAQ61_004745 [Plenodomus lingam]
MTANQLMHHKRRESNQHPKKERDPTSASQEAKLVLFVKSSLVEKTWYLYRAKQSQRRCVRYLPEMKPTPIITPKIARDYHTMVPSMCSSYRANLQVLRLHGEVQKVV